MASGMRAGGASRRAGLDDEADRDLAALPGGDARDMSLKMGQVAAVDSPVQPEFISEVQVRTAP
jgi:hypothetical protein